MQPMDDSDEDELLVVTDDVHEQIPDFRAPHPDRTRVPQVSESVMSEAPMEVCFGDDYLPQRSRGRMKPPEDKMPSSSLLTAGSHELLEDDDLLGMRSGGAAFRVPFLSSFDRSISPLFFHASTLTFSY